MPERFRKHKNTGDHRQLRMRACACIGGRASGSPHRVRTRGRRIQRGGSSADQTTADVPVVANSPQEASNCRIAGRSVCTHEAVRVNADLVQCMALSGCGTFTKAPGSLRLYLTVDPCIKRSAQPDLLFRPERRVHCAFQSHLVSPVLIPGAMRCRLITGPPMNGGPVSRPF